MSAARRFLCGRRLAVAAVAVSASAAMYLSHHGLARLRAQEPTRRDVSAQAARSSPPWVADAVVYEINPRTFSPQGTLAGITARLDDLKDLGVTVLWLMPIHPVGKERAKGSYGSPYAVADYYAINADYGTADDLRRLVTEAHRRGLRVILDIVANHTAWDSVLMRKPGFHTTKNGQVVAPVEDWSDVADLDYSNPELRAYMIEMLQYWVREFDLDGFRCDVAFLVPTDFWEQARAALDRTKSDIFLLAEAAEPELLVNAFDADYAWPLHSALSQVFMGDQPATAIRDAWLAERARYPRGALRMHFSDNHDERRAIARFGERGALAASALVFTLDGIPMLYNGMEVGDTTESGAPALFERLPVFWSISERRPHFRRFYRGLIELRRAHAALRSGEVVWLRNSDEARVLTFLRRDRAEEVLVAINTSTRPFSGVVEVRGGDWEDVTPTGEARPQNAAGPAAVRAVAVPAIPLDAWGVRVLRRSR